MSRELCQILFPYIFFFITTCLGIFALSFNPYFSEVVPLRQWCEVVDQQFISLGLYNKKGIAIEAFMAFVCWSTTYLFIRRLWNPETSKSTFEKYSADSFFGGLAAAGSILLKNILLNTLAEKKF